MEQVLLVICVAISLTSLIFMFWIYKKNVQNASQNDQLHIDDVQLQQNTLQTQQAFAQVHANLDHLTKRLDHLVTVETTNSSEQKVLTQDIQKQVSDMSRIMTNNKKRGNWGEFQLQTLLELYAGTSHKIYEPQYKLSNNTFVDIALHMPGTSRIIGIDSKFPAGSYDNLCQAQAHTPLYAQARSQFIKDVRKHIDAIATKYILPPQTTEYALMFIPSEAIYAEICEMEEELFAYALARRVLVCSPATLVGIISTLMGAQHDWERTKNLDEIVKRMHSIADDAKRLNDRAQTIAQRFQQFSKAVDDVEISSRKIATQIDRLVQGYVSDEK